MLTPNERISPQQAREDMRAGAVLVCAYDSEAKFQQNHLEGAISLDEFQSREGATAPDQEIIFYCA